RSWCVSLALTHPTSPPRLAAPTLASASEGVHGELVPRVRPPAAGVRPRRVCRDPAGGPRPAAPPWTGGHPRPGGRGEDGDRRYHRARLRGEGLPGRDRGRRPRQGSRYVAPARPPLLLPAGGSRTPRRRRPMSGRYRIDAGRSRFTVQAFAAGMLSF